MVTGTGGFEDALALAHAGAEVIIAGRNPSKGEEAVELIRQNLPKSNVSFEAVDLADLKSVAALGERLAAFKPCQAGGYVENRFRCEIQSRNRCAAAHIFA